ncbi:hypothetical protein TIFTF001_041361 [Ficus carica]|uniref:Uncharacterized protein n=1 Tax=Ficus carica TaxID=3494 RepID=A0AA87Z5G5_FICCA|nr:hypothetical protein TIFTF001_041352 [Ficus carica]GMN29750.1 hypothetical protein TIFTF001_041355 [Ficus carica]GMN29767.1 hypothetical protein TIFTF001_041358 [Ficus carica]GMN29792.1 hypothetical protein TIFTF001_041361 [Ficus carica]
MFFPFLIGSKPQTSPTCKLLFAENRGHPFPILMDGHETFPQNSFIVATRTAFSVSLDITTLLDLTTPYLVAWSSGMPRRPSSIPRRDTILPFRKRPSWPHTRIGGSAFRGTMRNRRLCFQNLKAFTISTCVQNLDTFIITCVMITGGVFTHDQGKAWRRWDGRRSGVPAVMVAGEIRRR